MELIIYKLEMSQYVRISPNKALNRTPSAPVSLVVVCNKNHLTMVSLLISLINEWRRENIEGNERKPQGGSL